MHLVDEKDVDVAEEFVEFFVRLEALRPQKLFADDLDNGMLQLFLAGGGEEFIH